MHPGVFVRSVYFQDPDGILLEFAAWTRSLTPARRPPRPGHRGPPAVHLTPPGRARHAAGQAHHRDEELVDLRMTSTKRSKSTGLVT